MRAPNRKNASGPSECGALFFTTPTALMFLPRGTKRTHVAPNGAPPCASKKQAPGKNLSAGRWATASCSNFNGGGYGAHVFTRCMFF
jgi:hypothetical protein